MKENVVLVPSCSESADFSLSEDSDKICDHPLPRLSILLRFRRQGLYDKILMTADPHNNVRRQHIFSSATRL